KLAPGVRMNISASGISASFGPRGASVSVGKHGVYGNVGLPGTGLSMRSKLSGAQPRAQAKQVAGTTEVPLTVGVDDDGVLFFHDQSGTPVTEKLNANARKQRGRANKGPIQPKFHEINQPVEALGQPHLTNPSPTPSIVFTPQDYGEPRP